MLPSLTVTTSAATSPFCALIFSNIIEGRFVWLEFYHHRFVTAFHLDGDRRGALTNILIS